MDFVRFLWLCDGLYHSESEAVLSIFVQPRIPLSYFKARLHFLHFSLNIFFRLVNRLYRHDINRNQTLFTLTFWSLLETFVRRSCSILLPVLATVVMWRGKRSVVRMAQCTAALGCRTGCKVHYTVLHTRLSIYGPRSATILVREKCMHHRRSHSRSRRRVIYYYCAHISVICWPPDAPAFKCGKSTHRTSILSRENFYRRFRHFLLRRKFYHRTRHHIIHYVSK